MFDERLNRFHSLNNINSIIHLKFKLNKIIVGLNTEDFSNFLWCLDIIFSTYYYERTHKNVRKNREFFRIFWNFCEFFPFFRGFLFSVFLRNDAQSRDMHHKIPHKISHRTVNMRSLRATEGIWFHTKNRPKL